VLIQSPTIDRIEDLSEHEGIEYESLDDIVVVLVNFRVVRMVREAKDMNAQEVENKLVGRLKENLLVHISGK
jgi:hypothetical protein